MKRQQIKRLKSLPLHSKEWFEIVSAEHIKRWREFEDRDAGALRSTRRQLWAAETEALIVAEMKPGTSIEPDELDVAIEQRMLETHQKEHNYDNAYDFCLHCIRDFKKPEFKKIRARLLRADREKERWLNE